MLEMPPLPRSVREPAATPRTVIAMEQPEPKEGRRRAVRQDERVIGFLESSRTWIVALQQLVGPVTSLEGLEKAYFEQHPRTAFREELEKLVAGLLAFFLPLLPQIVALTWLVLGLLFPFRLLRLLPQDHSWVGLLHFGLFACTFKRCVFVLHAKSYALLNRILLCGFSRWEDLSEAMPEAFSTGMSLRAAVRLDSVQTKPALIRSGAESALRAFVEKQVARLGDAPRSAQGLTRQVETNTSPVLEPRESALDDSHKQDSGSAGRDTSALWEGCSIWLRTLLRVYAFGTLCSKHYVVVATMAGVATLGTLRIRVPGSTLATEIGIDLVVIAIAVGVLTRFMATSKSHGWILSQAIGVVGIVILSFHQFRVLFGGIARLTGWPSLLLVGGLCVALIWACVRVFYLPGRILLYAIQFLVGTFLLQDLSGLVGEIASAFDGEASSGMRRLVELKVAAGIAILAKMFEELLKDLRVLVENIEKSALQLFERSVNRI